MSASKREKEARLFQNIMQLFLSKLLKKLRQRLLDQRNIFLTHLNQVVDVLDSGHIDYVIFKTIRPVPETPVDIDVLVESKDDAHYVITRLRKRFHVEVWGEDRYSIGIRIPEFNEYIDFYVKPHVADFVYLDSEVLIKNKMYLFIDEVGVEVLIPVPKPEFEFCSILARSIIKEGLITLNDVISLIAYELLSSRDELIQWLSELSLKIAYREIINKLEGIFPVRINYMTVFKVLTPLLRKKYVTSSLPHFALGLSKRLSRIIERRERLTYVRGLGR